MTAHEQPAAGVALKAAIEFMDAAAVMLGRGEMPAPGTKYAADWYLAHNTVLTALRAPTDAGGAVSEAADRNQWHRLGDKLPDEFAPILTATKRDGEDFWRVRDGKICLRHEGAFASLEDLKDGKTPHTWWIDSIYPGTGDLRLAKADLLWRYMPTPDEAALTPAPQAEEEKHPDDLAVDRFAAAMKAKLAQKRADGRGGWEDKTECSAEFLSNLLRGHVNKGDPLDVGNLAMMLHQRGEGIATHPASDQSDTERVRAAATKALEFLDNVPLESGVCRCGDPVSAHNAGSGHSPVDDVASYADGVAEALRSALAEKAADK